VKRKFHAQFLGGCGRVNRPHLPGVPPMNAPENRESVMNLLRAEFHREWASDFAMLRRSPSTQARMFLDYFSALDEAQRNALAEGLAERALLSIYPEANDGRPSTPGTPRGDDSWMRCRSCGTGNMKTLEAYECGWPQRSWSQSPR